MERESFEDAQTAALMNEHFISVKVDREERPDIDQIYMDACVGLTGQGGWPLSCFLTPDKKPFYAGTYYPKEDRYGMPGFKKILKSIAALWNNDRMRLLKASDKVLEHVSRQTEPAKGEIYHDLPDMAYRELQQAFDARNGGFGTATKFPSVQNILFLMRYGIYRQNKEAFKMAEKTLACMAKGGIHDHIGGGFCRYSTDAYWLVPHFEKMMYDNAMLTIAYCEAGAALDKSYFNIATRIIQYCLSEMRHGEGGFYTAEDADSEGVEGKYYVFTPEEVEFVLGAENGKRFCGLFNITDEGNFEGKSIPNLIGMELEDEDRLFAEACFGLLYLYRKNRIPPFKDDKVLSSVNGLMIAALSTAGRLMNRRDYTEEAKKCARFILRTLYVNGRLYASFRNGMTAHAATLDDYAYLSWGLLELYQATLDAEWLAQTIQIVEDMLDLFGSDGAFYIAGKDVSDLPARTKSVHDGALPSGNSVAANVLMHLGEITGNEVYTKKAERILAVLSQAMQRYPMGFTGLLCAQLLKQDGMRKIAIVNGRGAYELLQAAKTYSPFTHVVLCGEGYESVLKLSPECAYYRAADERAVAYMCDAHGCRPPFTEAEQIERALKIQ